MVWFAIILGIVSFIGLGYSFEKTDGIAMITVLSVFGMFFSLLMIYDAFSTAPVSHEYPSDEYVLEYKVTTIGEKCDTTYVLTKIKTD